jgi:phosphoglycolate phosphatase-like HAD superfamily hydrolase
MQVRPLVDSLANRRLASRLQLTEEQQNKVAEIIKDVQTQQTQMRDSMRNLRDATQEQRTEVFQKFRKIRSDADEKALGLLTDEQKEALEKMKGAKIELPARPTAERLISSTPN